MIFDETRELGLAWHAELCHAGFFSCVISEPKEFAAAFWSQQKTAAIIYVSPLPSLRQILAPDKTHRQRPRTVFVVPEFSPDVVLQLARKGDLVLPIPTETGILARSVELLKSTAVDTAEFAGKYKLSPRETALLELTIRGLSDADIAEHFGCSHNTLAKFWSGIFRKTRVSGQRDVIILFLQSWRGGTFRLNRRRLEEP